MKYDLDKGLLWCWEQLGGTPDLLYHFYNKIDLAKLQEKVAEFLFSPAGQIKIAQQLENSEPLNNEELADFIDTITKVGFVIVSFLEESDRGILQEPYQTKTAKHIELHPQSLAARYLQRLGWPIKKQAMTPLSSPGTIPGSSNAPRMPALNPQDVANKLTQQQVQLPDVSVPNNPPVTQEIQNEQPAGLSSQMTTNNEQGLSNNLNQAGVRITSPAGGVITNPTFKS